jgi:hypothetical protein
MAARAFVQTLPDIRIGAHLEHFDAEVWSFVPMVLPMFGSVPEPHFKMSRGLYSWSEGKSGVA